MSIPINLHEHSTTAWIGLVHVKPRAGNETLGGASGAIVTALALARDRDEFVRKVTAKLNSYEFDVVEIEDVELCKTAFANRDVSREVLALAGALTPICPVALHTFHSYP